jgi:tetratricopeptide (TPR) repeat protein
MTIPNASRAARLAALRWIAVAILAATVAAVAPHVMSRGNNAPHAEALSIGPAVGMPGAPATSTSGLLQRIDDMEARLRAQPDDTGAAVLLADALLRQARATNDGRPAGRASEVLNAALKEHPGQYDVLRMLGAIYLSQHRFRDALEIARRSREQRPDDAWNYGVMGDAQIELGEYSDAFDAFDKMMTLRPNAAAYARVAYARELQGDVGGALTAMQRAAKATAPNDPEAQAWYAAQTGELYLKLHKLDDADREFRRAVFLFPNYPLAMIGKAKSASHAVIVKARWQSTWSSSNERRRSIWRRGSATCTRRVVMPHSRNTTTSWQRISRGRAWCRPRRISRCISRTTIARRQTP